MKNETPALGLSPTGQTRTSDYISSAMLLLGLAAVFIPTCLTLWNTKWQTDDNAHGLIVLAVVLWMFWQVRTSLLETTAAPNNLLGWPLVVFGILFYVFGRTQEVLLFEVGSLIPIFAAVLLLTKGWRAIRIAWFPLAYMVFMIPMPQTLVDALTSPLKQYISVIVENILYAVGYPIGRQGIGLTVGNYQLEVADACSGLHSMFSLLALGLLFLYLMQRKSRAHNLIMMAGILPVSFVANVIRVIVLVLVTYHLGDEAGQGFLHKTAGIILHVIALLLLFALDVALCRIFRQTPSEASK